MESLPAQSRQSITRMDIELKSDCGRIRKTDAVSLRRTITVKVGKNGTTFPVHEFVLCASSAFFKSAMKPEWTSATSRIVDLTDENPDVFEIYLNWLYFKTLPTLRDRSPALNTEYMDRAQCYVLGEKVLDVKSKNAVMDALVEVSENRPKDYHFIPFRLAIKTIYEGTTEGSPARKFLVDAWAINATPRDKANLTKCPTEFAIDLATRFLRLNFGVLSKPWKDSKKKYHEK